MKTKSIFLSVLLLLGVLTVFVQPQGSVAAASDIRRGGPGGRGANGVGMSQPVAATLTQQESDALVEAVLEEALARDTYQLIADELGFAYPFTQIAKSEQQHLNALLRQAQQYGVVLPEIENKAVLPAGVDTLTDACEFGVGFEKEDAALYDKLSPLTTSQSILRVYSRLQSASLNNHLRIFETCN